MILGTSSGIPQPDRISSGYVIANDSDLTIIDCGSGTTHAFLNHGFSFTDVSRIIISHTHSDHIGDLTLFLQGLYLYGRREPVDLYLPEEFVDIFRQYLTAVYLFPERFPFEFRLHGYAGQTTFDGGFPVTAFPNSHLEKYSEYVERAGGENKLQSHSFGFELGNKGVLLSADIGSLDDLKPFLSGRDVVVMEMSHIDRDTFFRVAADYDVKRYVITHIGSPDEPSEILQEARKVGLDNLEIAYDGMRIEL